MLVKKAPLAGLFYYILSVFAFFEMGSLLSVIPKGVLGEVC